MQTLVWMIVGFSATVILPNEIGTSALPALVGERVAARTGGTASPLIADSDVGMLVRQENADTLQSSHEISAVPRGSSQVRSQLCKLQV